MKLIFFVHFATILQLIEANKADGVQNQSSNKTHMSERSEKLGYKPADKKLEIFYFVNSSEELSEQDIYSVENTEKILDVDLKNNSHDYKSEMKTAALPNITSGKLFEHLFEYYHYNVTDNPEEIKIVSNNVSNFLENESINSSSMAVYTSSKMTESKLNESTTYIPFSESYFLLKKKFQEEKIICLCDLKVNECDINCCCDKDCSLYHLKVFLKFSDDNHWSIKKYCCKNYFTFESNRSPKMVQEGIGLFGVARENLKSRLIYEMKPIITTLEDFNKILPKYMYDFTYKTETKSEFTADNYLAGLPVWTVYDGKLLPFKISFSTIGLLCNSEVSIKYLVDQTTTCFIKVSCNECESKKIRDMLHYLRHIEIISNPDFINGTQKLNFSKICENKICVKITSYLCHLFGDTFECFKDTKNTTQFFDIGHSYFLSHIEYQIFHNGSYGIINVEAHIWIKILPQISNELLLPFVTKVNFSWVGSTKKVFKGSGNAGYLTGKPIMTGKKINNVFGPSPEKEATEIFISPDDWLSVLGSRKGLCSSKDKTLVYFRENSQFTCSLKLGAHNFTKEKCLELQYNIFELLVGTDLLNSAKENYVNKFVATFGNSRAEEIRDWVQVLMDLLPLTSSQGSFKSNHYNLMCKNIITDLYIDIVYSNIGLILVPQGKILGVFFHFGKHKDLTYHCYTTDCENTSLTQYYKLSTYVRFIDVTDEPVDTFAEPLHLEAKLPHDFFYPFFSRGFKPSVFKTFTFIVILSAVH